MTDLVSGARVTVRSPQVTVAVAPDATRTNLVGIAGPAGPRGPAGPDTAAALADHIAAENPHPTYDQMLDLALLFENGLI